MSQGILTIMYTVGQKHTVFDRLRLYCGYRTTMCRIFT